jgi:hypothetical protein
MWTVLDTMEMWSCGPAEIGPHYNLTYDVVVSCVGEMKVLSGSFIITNTSQT